MKKMMVLSSVLGVAFTTGGLWLSYALNLTSGATIILVSGTAYLLSLAGKAILHKRSPVTDASSGNTEQVTPTA